MKNAACLFDSSELALAAYANLGNGSTGAGVNLDALKAVSDVGVSPTQVEEFASRYPTIVTQFNDSADEGGMGTGFSATVFKAQSGQLTLAIRGTDRLTGSGSDLSTDADIFLAGAGYDQIVAMVNWWSRATAPAGELVRQFRLVEVPLHAVSADAIVLRADDDSAYVLDVAAAAPATGEVGAGVTVDVTGHSLGGHLAMAFSTIFAQQTGQVTVFNAPGFKDNATIQAFFAKLGGEIPAAGNIVNVIADQALVGEQAFDAIAACNSRPGAAVDVAIENQWNSDESTPFGAGNHSITALVDSLAVYKLLADLDPGLSAEGYKTILNQAVQGSAGGYERIVDNLNRLLRNVDEPLPAGNSNRDSLYDALYKLWDSEDYKSQIGHLKVLPVVANATTLLEGALSDGAQGLAYRYALVKGDPMVVLENGAIFERHNARGELDRYDPASRTGTLTDQWLRDRAAFLQRKLDIAARDEINDIDNPTNLNNETKTWEGDELFFDDRATNYRINQGGQRVHDSHIVFGTGGSDGIAGSNKADRLYGGGGTNYFDGGEGDDWLEGGAGLDVYQYDSAGGLSSSSNDGVDTIRDADGNGVLRYTYRSSDGARQSTVIADASVKLSDGIWQSADGRIIYTRSGGDLVVTIDGVDGGGLTIKNFSDGDYGIRLWEAANPLQISRDIVGDREPKDFDPETDGVQTQLDDLGNVITDASVSAPDRTDALNDSALNDSILSLGGNDTVTALRGGDDRVSAGDGRDWVDAGIGNDLIEGGTDGTYDGQIGGDVLHGGVGDDEIYGEEKTALADALQHGNSEAGTNELGEFVSGGDGNDWIISSGGNDLLSGGSGKDLIIAGAGNDDIWGDSEYRAGLGWNTTRWVSGNDLSATFNSSYSGSVRLTDGSVGGDDVIYSGAGEDWVSGEAGDDFIDGGAGDDVLYGMQGLDVLIGGDGDDWITGDFASGQTGLEESADYLDGGQGIDHLLGNGGADVLIGGAGNDVIVGGAGKDIYVFERGDGEDTIVDIPAEANDPDASIVVFGAGVHRSDIKFRRGSLLVDLGPQDPQDPASPRDALHFEGFDPLNPYSTPVIGELRFADGTRMSYEDILAQGFDIDGTNGDDDGITAPVVEGTAVDDRIRGYQGNDVLVGFDGNDTLEGGSGRDQLDGGTGEDYLDGGAGIDVLAGGLGDDTYVFDPLDSVSDTGGNDTVMFGTGITPDALQIAQLTVFNQPRLLISQTGTDAAGMVLQNTSLAQQQFSFEFADGTRLTLQELAQIAYTVPQALYGGSSDDVLTGYAGFDRLYGRFGNDRLYGGRGHDELDGGAGNDVLEGGAQDDVLSAGAGDDVLRGGGGDDYLYGGNGADTYRFSRGDGSDTISDGGFDDAVDTILIDDWSSASDIELSRQANGDLRLLARESGDSMTVRGWYTQPANRIERIVFTDGTILTEEALDLLTVPAIEGSDEPDNLAGTPYDDSLVGLAGDDFLDGGKGDDVLYGNSGRDIYTLSWGGGKDDIVEIPGEASVIVLAPGMDFADLEAQRTDADLFIRVRGTEEGLVIKDYFDQEHEWQLKTAAGDAQSLTEFLMRGRATTGSPVWDLWEQRKTAWKAEWYRWREGEVLMDGRVHRIGDRVDVTAYATYFNGTLHSLSGGLGGFSEYYDNYGFDGVESDASTQFWADNKSSTITVSRATAGIQWKEPRIGTNSWYIGSMFGVDGIVHEVYQTNVSLSLSGRVASITTGLVSGMAAEELAAMIIITREAGYFSPPSIVNGNLYTVTNSFKGLEIHAGPSNNVIGSRAFGLIDGGDGDDVIDDQAGGFSNSEIGGDFLYGGAGEDRITGSGRADLIIGGDGNDQLAGCGDNDTYYVIPTDTGVDVINEVTWYLWDTYDGRALYAADCGFRSRDTIEFGAGLSIDDLRLSWGSVPGRYAWWSPEPTKPYDTLDIYWATDKGIRVMLPDRRDPVVVRDMDIDSPGRSWGIEYFMFADGTRLSMEEMLQRAPTRTVMGTPYDDYLVGQAGSDVLDGGTGDDLLDGDTGNDTYTFDVGDGIDVIMDASGTDTIAFGPGIALSDISLDVGSLMIRVGRNGDAIHIEGFDPNRAAESVVIEKLTFADGTQIGYADLLRLGFDLQGSQASETIGGTSVSDRIFGLEGDDTLMGGDEADTLFGGSGDDLLKGGAGSDRYVLENSFGIDLIEDQDVTGADMDTVAIDALPDDVLAEGQGTILTLAVAGTNDRLSILWQPEAGYGIERVEFADGTVWDKATLASFFPPPNRPPKLGVDVGALLALEDQPFSFTLPEGTFLDPDDNDTLTLTATLAGGSPLPGWLAFDATAKTFSGTPGNGDVASLRISLTATDSGGLSASTDISLQVVNVNDAPFAVDDVASAIEDGSALVIPQAALLANDVDVDADDARFIAAVADSSAGVSVSIVGGEVVYDVAHFFQELPQGATTTDAFTYTVADMTGAAATATVVVTITGANDAPVTASDVASVEEDGVVSVTGNVLANDVDVDTATVLGITDAGVFQGAYGALALGEDGAYTYVLSNALPVVQSLREGQTLDDSFQYEASDGMTRAAGVLDIEITGVNDAPTLLNTIPAQFGNQGAFLAFTVAADTFFDVDVNDVLALNARRVDGNELPGWLNFDSVSRTFNGMPTEDDTGAIDISITATDSAGAAAPVIFTLSVSDAAAVNRQYSGTRRDDFIDADFSNDFITAGSGDDIVKANAGRDLVFGDAGNDVLYGGHGRDRLYGGLGDDELDGGADHDQLYGGKGHDLLQGAAGDDLLAGGAGHDRLAAGAGRNVVIGGKGNDVITSGASGDVLLMNPGDGNDILFLSEAGVPGNKDVLSFGGGIRPEHLYMKRRDSDLIIEAHTDTDDENVARATLKDWYAESGAHQSLDALQLFENGEALIYDFKNLVQRFDLDTGGRLKGDLWRASEALTHIEPAWTAPAGGSVAEAYAGTGMIEGELPEIQEMPDAPPVPSLPRVLSGSAEAPEFRAATGTAQNKGDQAQDNMSVRWKRLIDAWFDELQEERMYELSELDEAAADASEWGEASVERVADAWQQVRNWTDSRTRSRSGLPENGWDGSYPRTLDLLGTEAYFARPTPAVDLRHVAGLDLRPLRGLQEGLAVLG